MLLMPARYRDGLWWVNLPTPTSFTSRKAANEALDQFKEEYGCLHTECNELGTDDIGLGFGFRFCERHARRAKKILNKSNRGSAIFRGASFENI